MLLVFFLIVSNYVAASISDATIEESRVDKAAKAMAHVTSQFTPLLEPLLCEVLAATDYGTAEGRTRNMGTALWRAATGLVGTRQSYDDRPLYWSRLQLSQKLRSAEFGFSITISQRHSLLELLEDSSRGINTLGYSTTAKKILISGFDPFLLDRNIQQSNPSGVIALMLDGKVIVHEGIEAEIQAFIVPVRFKDFDKGEIERILSPFYSSNQIDLIATISMGRPDFDLEIFPGRRRSASSPDNLNVHTGASAEKPLVPELNNEALPGPEFVKSTLPVAAMQKAPGIYGININKQVTTLSKTFKPGNLAELAKEISVRGSGGGYLSNEISYRSIRLKETLNSDIPTGHIHTPRISRFEPAVLRDISAQVLEMLKLTLSEI
jgi:pyrrolidone-carboxylate peptidase